MSYDDELSFLGVKKASIAMLTSDARVNMCGRSFFFRYEQMQYSQLTGSFLFRYEEGQCSQLTCDAPMCVCVCLTLYPRVNLCVRSFLVRYEQRQYSH